jgi:hypothetical protein
MKPGQSLSKRQEIPNQVGNRAQGARCSKEQRTGLVRSGETQEAAGLQLAAGPPGQLGRASLMLAFGSQKDRWLVRFLLVPHSKDDADPDMSQGANGHAMAFSLLSFPVVVISRPGFLLSALPGKLVQRIAQRFDAGKPLMNRSCCLTHKVAKTGRYASEEEKGKDMCPILREAQETWKPLIVRDVSMSPGPLSVSLARERSPQQLRALSISQHRHP